MGPADPSRAQAAAQTLARMSDGVVALDPSLTFLYANAPAARAVGTDPEAIVGRHIWDVWPHLKGTVFEQHAWRALQSQEEAEFEEFSVYVGRWVWRRFYPTATGVTVVIRESALPRSAAEERAASLEHAETSEQQYRELLDGIAEGVTETSPDGAIVVANRAFATMLGYESAAELMTEVPHVHGLYADPGDRTDLHSASAFGGSLATTETQLRRRDGSALWLRVRATPRFSPAGDLVSVRAVVEDMTAQRLVQQRLDDAFDRIASRERALLAEAIHDEPLQLIFAAILRLDVLQRQVPGAAATSLEQITLLLDQAVAKLRRLIVALSPPALDAGLGVALLSLAQGIFIVGGTAVDLVGPAYVPLSDSTKAAAFRILREALINARKHARAEHVLIELDVRSSVVVLTVADDGVGDDALATEPGHLGLVTMRSRAKAMGAELTVASTPGAGTRVSLVVPRAASEA